MFLYILWFLVYFKAGLLRNVSFLDHHLRFYPVNYIQPQVSESGMTGSRGYGGSYGVETDRMDKSAVGHEYQVSDPTCNQLIDLTSI